MTCASATISPSATAQGGPVAPNESVVEAQVTKAVEVDSSTVGIEPPQRLALLTLRVVSTTPSGALLPAVPKPGVVVETYSRDPERMLRLSGTTIRAAVQMRGGERSPRLWIVRVIEPAPPNP